MDSTNILSMAIQISDDVAVKLFNMTMNAIHDRARGLGRITYDDIEVLHFWFIDQRCQSNKELFMEIMENASPSINYRDTRVLNLWTELETLSF